jgi:hypothetical protein
MEKIAVGPSAKISISVVSHAQIHLVKDLLHDIDKHCRSSSIGVILTLNLEETLPFAVDGFSFPMTIIRNATPKGFAANHNQAFEHAAGRYYCVMNPDIRLEVDPFPALIGCLQDTSIGGVAPIVVDGKGEMEDSARRFPTPLRIFCKAFGGCKGIDYAMREETLFPDWVGGMFMLFPSGVFRKIKGFDTRYFMYYEDVDLCARLTLCGYRVALCHEVSVIHEARRASHANLRHLRWHVMSALRFFLSPVYRQLKYRK